MLAAGLLALHATFTYGMTSQYDFVAGDLQPIDVMILLLVACLALLLLLGARDLLGARRPTTAVLVAAVLTLFCGAATASATLGAAAHDRRTTTVATACSGPGPRAARSRGVPRLPARAAQRPGRRLRAPPLPADRRGDRVSGLTADLARAGWRTAGPDGETTTLERDGAVLAVTAETDDKATELVLTLR